jgi:DNA-binding transcriptional ArsR family regulator
MMNTDHISNPNPLQTQHPDSGQTLRIDYLSIKKAALVLRALNHKLRQQMIQLLEEQQRMTVTELYVQLRLEQSVASQHLAILRRAGIVKAERDGKFIFYRINEDRVRKINDFVDTLLNN